MPIFLIICQSGGISPNLVTLSEYQNDGDDDLVSSVMAWRFYGNKNVFGKSSSSYSVDKTTMDDYSMAMDFFGIRSSKRKVEIAIKQKARLSV